MKSLGFPKLSKGTLLQLLGVPYLLKISNLLYPILLIPIITKKFGIDFFSQLAYLQAMGVIGAAIIEYGFNITGARALKVAADTQRELLIIAEILKARLLLALVVVILLGLIYWGLNLGLWEFVLVVCLALFQGLSLVWIFQGKTKYPLILVLDVGSKLMTLSVFYGLSGDVGTSQIYLLYVLPFLLFLLLQVVAVGKLYPWKEIILELRNTSSLKTIQDAWSIFVFRITGVLYTFANPLLAKHMFGLGLSAAFIPNDRLIRSGLSLISPVVDIFSPIISGIWSRNDSVRLKIKKTLFFSLMLTAVGTLMSLCLWLAKDFIISYFFGDVGDLFAEVFLILSLLPMVVTLGTVVVYFWMVPMKMDNTIQKITLVTLLFHFAGVLLVVRHLGTEALAYQIIFSELLTLILGGVAVLVRLARQLKREVF